MKNLYSFCSQVLVAIGLVMLASCGKGESPAPSVPDSTSTGPVHTSLRVDGVHDIAVDTAPHTNVMKLQIVADAGDSALTELQVAGLPQGITAILGANEGRGSFSTTLSFTYDYSGTPGSFPAEVIISKGDSTKRLPFNLIVPPTPAQGWVFAGQQIAADIVTYVIDSPNHMIWARGGDMTFRFHFNYKLQPLPTKETSFPLSPWFNQSIYNTVIGFQLGMSRPFAMEDEQTVSAQYYYNGGKLRIRATRVVVFDKQNDTLSRRYLSFDLQLR